MAVVIITGSAGLVGSEASRYFAERGLQIVGIDNDMRRVFFGPDASTEWNRLRLEQELGKNYIHVVSDIRDSTAVRALFKKYGRSIKLVIHAAAQPSHDWAATRPTTDFHVNAVGTLNLLNAALKFCPDAPFIFTSTNKVYGDAPNRLPLVELEKRYEIAPGHPFANGIPEHMSIDQCRHSMFGASKVAADVLVQEYGRYYGMQTVCFRAGCLTGPNHAGAELHGFLSYLMKCTMTGAPYTVYGYKGKQVRDNLHSADLVRAFDEFFTAPRSGEVYNIGGGRQSNCSLLEAIEMCQEISGNPLMWTYTEKNRNGDHIWWISDLTKFRTHYPAWEPRHDVPRILREIYKVNSERWARSVHA